MPLKDPMSRPDKVGEKGGFCPKCKQKHDLETPTVARLSGKGQLYFGCPNFDPPYNCRFNGCRDIRSSLRR